MCTILSDRVRFFLFLQLRIWIRLGMMVYNKYITIFDVSRLLTVFITTIHHISITIYNYYQKFHLILFDVYDYYSGILMIQS